jgi:hypothetical protein
MTGMILDGVLMLLLVAALGYGVRLERKLSALRAGQLAFASAVSELNTAAGRAETALATLRASGHETDLLHDRIVKAREVKAQLEALMARSPVARGAPAAEPERVEPRAAAVAPAPVVAAPAPVEDERALRMAALAQRIQGLGAPAPSEQRAPQAGGNVSAILNILSANQAAKQSINQARRSLDEDLFAA